MTREDAVEIVLGTHHEKCKPCNGSGTSYKTDAELDSSSNKAPIGQGDSMDRMDAAEEVLRGPYSDCTWCEGTGKSKEKFKVSSQYIGLCDEDCKHCKGTGKWRRHDYVQACLELNIEPAPHPGKLVEVDFGNIERMTWSIAERERMKTHGLAMQNWGRSSKSGYLTYGMNPGILDQVAFDSLVYGRQFEKEYMGVWMEAAGIGKDQDQEDDEGGRRRGDSPRQSVCAMPEMQGEHDIRAPTPARRLRRL